MTTEWTELPDLQAVAKAQSLGWEIWSGADKTHWEPWTGNYWSDAMTYRGRPAQPKTRTIKLLCWYNGSLNWYAEGDVLPSDDWYRVPAEDKVIEVSE